MGAKLNVLGQIMSFPPYLRYAMVQFPFVIRVIQFHCYIHLRNLTKRPINRKEFWVLGFFFRMPQNSNSRGTKSTIYIDKVPLTLLPWVGLIDTNTNEKEPQICPGPCIPKRDFK